MTQRQTPLQTQTVVHMHKERQRGPKVAMLEYRPSKGSEEASECPRVLKWQEFQESSPVESYRDIDPSACTFGYARA